MMYKITFLICIVSLIACTGCKPTGTVESPPAPESLEPLTGSEIRYLAFQIFEGNSDSAIPFDDNLIYTPKEKVAAIAHDLVSKIGVTGGERTRLAIILGPIAFDHTDAEVKQIIDDGFEIAAAEHIAIGFHIDDAMFWRKRSDLMGDTANVEWINYEGKQSTGLFLDWAHPPARMTYNSHTIKTEVIRRADLIGQYIALHTAELKLQGKEDLFAGVIVGWESHMGQDIGTKSRVGYHALSNVGFSANNPPKDINKDIASIVGDFINLWTNQLAQSGINTDRIYTHVAFLPRARFEEFTVPQGVIYEDILDGGSSTQRPSVAFAKNVRPGFTTYPHSGVFDQIQEERALHGNPWWASAEGSSIVPGEGAENPKMSMETYLARCFNHGAALVTLFGWGIGGQVKPDIPFRLVAENPASIKVYKKFLLQ